MFVEGLGADAQDQLTDLKLGEAKQIALGFADQQSGQFGNLLIDREVNLGFKQFRFLLLFCAEREPDHEDFLLL
jgi:hypothetical protein